MILGIDAGGYSTKVCGPFGVASFLSDIGEYRERNLNNGNFGPDDMVWEYNGEKGFAGTLARFESEWSGSTKGDTKAHKDALLRILLAIHRFSDEVNHYLIVGQPIGKHTLEQKEKIKRMLIGTHRFTLNGVEKNIVIKRVEVAAEGASGSLSDPKNGLVRIIDVGSGTINFGTLYNQRFIDRDSFSKPFGVETVQNRDPRIMARGIFNLAIERKWDSNDVVQLSGGYAKELYPALSEYFPRCELIKPKLKSGNSVRVVDPVYANAVAFYEIGRKVYEKETTQK